MGSKPVGLSASRGAAILGDSNYTTKFEIWQKIQEERKPGFNQERGFTYPEFKESAFIRFGRAFESSIILLSEKEQNKCIVDQEKLFTHKDHDFITCHIDGAYLPGTVSFKPEGLKDFPETLHEGKTTFEWVFNTKWGEPGSDMVPRDYHIQVQHQMMCTGAKEAIISVLVFPKSAIDWEDKKIQVYYNHGIPGYYYLFLGYPENFHLVDCRIWARVLYQMGFFHQYTVKRNDDLIEHMKDRYIEFWNENILGEKEPDEKTYEDIKRIIPNPCGSIVVTEVIEDMFLEYKDINKELSQSGTMAKRKNQLKALILEQSRKLDSVLDDESTNKIIFYNKQGKKIGVYGKNKKGAHYFR